MKTEPRFELFKDAGMKKRATLKNSLVTLDNSTGLLWMTDGNLSRQINWDRAIKWIKELNAKNYAGKNDWRLPSASELISIVDFKRCNPAIDTQFFRNTRSNYYWTSTTYAASTTSAWIVYFGGGYMDTNSKTITYYARAVRGGS